MILLKCSDFTLNKPHFLSHFTQAVSSGLNHFTGCKVGQSFRKAAGWSLAGKKVINGLGQLHSAGEITKSARLSKSKEQQTEMYLT